MDKKVLKFYEAPSVEQVEMELEAFLCASPVESLAGDDEEEEIEL